MCNGGKYTYAITYKWSFLGRGGDAQQFTEWSDIMSGSGVIMAAIEE